MRTQAAIAMALSILGCSGEASNVASASVNSDAQTSTAGAPRPVAYQSGGSTGSGATSTGAARCTDIMGQLMDTDPVGRNVRDAPGVNGRRLGAIPPPYLGSEGIRFPAVFDIIDSRDGWLLIENARLDPELVGPNAPATYAGRGWISGRGVQVTVQTALGFARPNHQAPITMDMRSSGGVMGAMQVEEFRLRGVHACSGNWVQLDWIAPDYQGVGTVGFEPSAVVTRDPMVIRAWHTGICNIQETTCDGVNGDGPHARP